MSADQTYRHNDYLKECKKITLWPYPLSMNFSMM
uniref:Uncharacterized protein n=1 Tax=Rhizophora mucronata TaxID=61149 RepID=A0A2P2R0B1_RHIMU